MGLLLTLLATGPVAAVAFTPAASADPTAPFETYPDPCDNAPPPVVSAHPDVIARVSVPTGYIQTETPFEDSQTVTAGDVAWIPVGAVAAGTSPYLPVINCSQPGDSSVEFFDVPGAPTSYSGAVSYTTQGGGPPDAAVLPWLARGTTRYVATVSLSGGAIRLSGGVSTRTFDSSGQYAIGSRNPGGTEINVDPVEGPTAGWTISIVPVPTTVDGVSFNHGFARSGAINTLRYSTTGSTTITAPVTRLSTGQRVRTLATAFPVSPGQHSLMWDGRDDDGATLQDGRYVATITSVDPYGDQTTGRARITLDNTPPTATLARRYVRLNQAIVVRFRDSGSGLASAGIIVNGHRKALHNGLSQVSYIPRGGWSPGRHSISATALDRAGNRLQKRLSFAAHVQLRHIGRR